MSPATRTRTRTRRTHAVVVPQEPVVSPPPAPPLDAAAALDRAARAVAPLWPLKHFVAVNPFLGMTEETFADAAHTVGRTAGARLTMPRAFYAHALRDGRIAERHLEAALVRHPVAADAGALRAAALAGGAGAEPRPLATVADVVGEITGHDWARIVTERVSAWAAAYFDEGQASWASPWRALPPFAAWHAEACIDRTPEVLGARGFRAAVRRLPADPAAAARVALERLGVAGEQVDPYLRRLATRVGGWTAFARYRGWDAELRGGTDATAAEIVAIVLAWEAALLESFGVDADWAEARASLAAPADDAELAVDLALHEAYEIAWQEEMAARLSAPADGVPAAPARPAAQAAFCIDVRSEPFRRALEAAYPEAATIGFAGFFGFAIEYVPLGEADGGARCPVLLTPRAVVPETLCGAAEGEAERVGAARLAARRGANAWKAFKTGAISCFSFVGPVGLIYLRKMVMDGLGLTRPVPHPAHDGIAAAHRARMAPRLDPCEVGGRPAGLAADDRVALAEGALRGMSLTDGFARLVLLAGHGSTTVNNPHATGLDCGACGGHTGEANARVAAQVLNDPAVRAALVERGIAVPADTWFVAGLHDTTTDEVTLWDAGVPATHARDVARLRAALAEAGRRTRAERAPRLGVRTDAEVLARSRDWSQVRPEWGLAGCAAFVAAPRHRTRGRDLGGRAFLHEYDWRRDREFGVLELILTAPVVVASWISLQYYGSTVDNRAFGSGNKALHNVVGALGVFEGNGGDLRTGLPWQSVHDGERLAHEPLRLNVVVEAPVAAMNDVLRRHPQVRALVDNGWLHLFAMDDGGALSHRYAGDLAWDPVSAA